MAGLGLGWVRREGGGHYLWLCWPCLACVRRLASKRGRGHGPSWEQSFLHVSLDLDQSYGQRQSTDARKGPVYIGSPRPWRIIYPFFLGELLLRVILSLASPVLCAILGVGIGIKQTCLYLFFYPVGVLLATN